VAETPYTIMMRFMTALPAWLRTSLHHWAASRLSNGVSRFSNGMPLYHWSRDRLLAVERDLKVALSWDRAVAGAGAWLLVHAAQNENFFLDLLDYLLYAIDPSRSGTEATQLELILESGGSAWRVAHHGEHYLLERRVAEAIVAAAEEAMASQRAGNLLRAAWVEAYGRDPNPSDAYRNAIRAVEAASQPTIIPNDKFATLGKMISALRAAPQKWQLIFSTHRGVDAVVSMFETLWKGQFDRHGTADASVPMNVTLEEAQAAVHLAATLVQWFSAEHISRVAQP
jgi:hypothetical protein